MKHLLTALLATTAIAGAAQAQDGKKVFFLLPNTTTIRFESRDAPFFVEAMKEKAPDAEVIVQNAQGDPQQQQRIRNGEVGIGYLDYDWGLNDKRS